MNLLKNIQVSIWSKRHKVNKSSKRKVQETLTFPAALPSSHASSVQKPAIQLPMEISLHRSLITDQKPRVGSDRVSGASEKLL